MKRLLALLLLLALLCGCSGQTASSEAPPPAPEEAYVPPPPPEAPPEKPVEESEPEPLIEVILTPEEADGLLSPGEGGIYAITTAEELFAFAVLVNGADDARAVSARIENDIDLAGLSFIPIGTEETPYRGYFDGGGHILRGLTVRTEGDFAGLFGRIASGGRVENTHIIGGSVNGLNMVGGIAGQCQGEIFACSFRGTVVAAGTHAGGICGELGREAPDTDAGTMRQCAANAELTGGSLTGGLAGSAVVGSIVSDCYARGSVTVDAQGESRPEMIGGLIGYANGEISNCLTSLELYTRTESRMVGAFIGSLESGLLDSCYYNLEPVENWKGVGDASGDEETPGLRACTVEEITEGSTFEGWDFEEVWSIEEGQNRGLPYLRVLM